MRSVLSIVIVSRNAREYLSRCLSSIEQNPPPFPFEVVVVDNASADGSPAMVREQFPSARVVETGRNAGFGPAANVGARAADSDVVLILNSDTEVLPDTLAIPVREIQRNPRAGVAAPLFVNGNGDIIQMSWGWTPLFFGEILQKFFGPRALEAHPWRIAIVRRLQRRKRAAQILCGAALFVRREVWERLGGMDEEFALYLEDSDLCVRARGLSYDALFLPEARIVHHLGKSSSDPRLALIFRQSQMDFYRKHGSALDRILVRIYLRLKFWRTLLPVWWPMSAEQKSFYRTMDRVLDNRQRLAL